MHLSEPTSSCLYDPLYEPVENPKIHNQMNWVGPFYRWESKINIWFVDRFSRRPFDIGQSKGLSLCQAAHVVDRLTILADFNSPNIFEERLANVIARANRSL